MTALTSLLVAFIQGGLLGCAFFYILWLSTQKIMGSTLAIPWFLVGWLSRMVLAAGGFYFIGMGNWQLLLASLCGFILGRSLISRLIGVKTKGRQADLCEATDSAKEVKHAP
jgi:F1F0 ATPase subunit 2